MSRLSRLDYKVRMYIADLATRREYRRAVKNIHDDVDNALPDGDEGVYIRGPYQSPSVASAEPAEPVIRRSGIGRRKIDLDADRIATKKLVVIIVVLVDILCLSGDTLFLRQPSCF